MVATGAWWRQVPGVGLSRWRQGLRADHKAPELRGKVLLEPLGGGCQHPNVCVCREFLQPPQEASTRGSGAEMTDAHARSDSGHSSGRPWSPHWTWGAAPSRGHPRRSESSRHISQPHPSGVFQHLVLYFPKHLQVNTSFYKQPNTPKCGLNMARDFNSQMRIRRLSQTS